MSTNKPSYAAVTVKAPEEAHQRADGPSGSSEPPPPYTVTGQSRHPNQNAPPAQPPHPCQQHVFHTQALMPAAHQQQQLQRNAHSGYLIPTAQAHNGVNGWTPPPNMSVARARAQRRFWVSMIYAWLIYLLIGALIGGGISDAHSTPHGRRGHWDKHGEWRDDGGRFFEKVWGSAPAVASEMSMASTA